MYMHYVNLFKHREIFSCNRSLQLPLRPPLIDYVRFDWRKDFEQTRLSEPVSVVCYMILLPSKGSISNLSFHSCANIPNIFL